MSKSRERREAARAKELAKVERAESAGRLELSNVLRLYECDDETVSSWLTLCATRRTAG
jgi:hypothetical protein